MTKTIRFILLALFVVSTIGCAPSKKAIRYSYEQKMAGDYGGDSVRTMDVSLEDACEIQLKRALSGEALDSEVIEVAQRWPASEESEKARFDCQAADVLSDYEIR